MNIIKKLNVKNVLFGFGVVSGVVGITTTLGMFVSMYLKLQTYTVMEYVFISFIYGIFIMGVLTGLYGFYKICKGIIKGFIESN